MIFFGGWRGFFGAIAGVIVLPLVLFAGLALILIFWAVISRKRVTKFTSSQNGGFRTFDPHPSPSNETRSPGVIETEATVIKRED